MPTLIRCPFHPRVTSVVRKRSRSFCQKCRWQVTPKHAYTLDHRSRSALTMPLSRQSVGIYQETSSHATPQGTLSHSRLSSLSLCGIIVCYLIFSFKRGKKPPPPLLFVCPLPVLILSCLISAYWPILLTFLFPRRKFFSIFR